ncbi:unnamed protein product [Pleuronectes platessa]|uniref:Uncharacterized protein n=1 Tax=Pleuronectes platessa TaxID=8262 RepID=A0A9N7VSK3_PLEPL|nr:unnamed protein product [Pleuronectes platessa]
MPKRKCSFTDELLKSFSAFRPGRDKWEALCTVCKAGTYVSVSNGGARDLKIHLDTEKHKTAVRGEALDELNIIAFQYVHSILDHTPRSFTLTGDMNWATAEDEVMVVSMKLLTPHSAVWKPQHNPSPCNCLISELYLL